MKVNLQPNQALYKMSETKRKQLFSFLLNEFQNSGNPSSSLFDSHKVPSSKKKATSIDKKGSGYKEYNGVKKGEHKKSKSYVN